MAASIRAKWSYLVLMALFLTLTLGGTVASAQWPSPPIRPTPVPTLAPAALDEETLGNLVIFAFFPGEEPAPIFVGSRGGSLQLLPGGSLALTLGYYECCYFFQPVPVSAVWSVSPDEGASIDPLSGLLTVDPATPSGSAYTVSADVENGRRIVSIELHVFTPEANPLVGYWVEIRQIDCATGSDVTPAESIEEFIFNADGTFSVTWFPFEVYKDYWGTYTFDPATGALDLVIESGNYIPTGFDGTGTYSLDPSGRLILSDIWLGSPPNTTATQTCGHIFS
jgi:hypothetical protein